MRHRLLALGLVVVSLVVVSLAFAAVAGAQVRPGVGYDPQGRGLVTSRYQLDTLGSPWITYHMDFTAQPDSLGTWSTPGVAALVERRWGPDTSTNRFKRWQGPGNEVASLLRDALVWAYANHPEILGGDTSNRDGVPTWVEMIDIQATNDTQLWHAFFAAELPGYSEEHRLTVCDANLPAGDGTYMDPFWGLEYYYHNTYVAPPPVSPQVPLSLSCNGG